MRLERASTKAIKYALMNFHYAKAIPSVQSAFSVFNDKNEWCGVICYSIGANKSIGTFANLPLGAVCELVRVALNGKQESTSKALSISLRLVKKNNPLLRLIVSYADIDQEHTGVIYQATNWYYLGETAQGQSAFIVNGRKTHNKTIHSKGLVQSLESVRKHLDPNATKFYSKGKRKYIYPLDKSLIPLCKSLSKPYPKHAIEVLPVAQQATSQQEGFDSTQSLNI
jgi:hypothetical protein